uniref:UPAR/Ly6 domain-containing protein n=1 Tax=Sinocyclocheilus anshuiensis TaxID=1608454 RepID=A0A671QGA0_9TELE
MSRGKGCFDNCHSGSQNVGFLRNVIECCDTDWCNAQYAPDPRTMVSNGKKCYYCDEKSCSNIMSCSGSEDGCITPRVVKGCISKEICDSMVSSAEVISCCSGNLCNSAERITQSFLFLCCSLLSFILLH